jgi:uncharacterized protein
MEINNESLEEYSNKETFEQDVFTNTQINSSSLPKIETIQYEGIQKTSLYVSLVVLGVFCLLGIIGAFAYIFFSENGKEYFWYILFAIAIISTWLLAVEIIGFKHIGFALREHDLIYKTGWIWKSLTVVPYKRIQHIEVHQGPIDRLFDLATLSLFTAGGSETEIEGLLPDQANSMKAFIMSKNNELKQITEIDESEE